MPEAHSRRRPAGALELEQRNRHPFGNRTEQRDGDVLSFAAVFTLEQRLQNPGIGVQPRGDIHHGHTDPAGCLRRAGGT